jgi:hypothetical protein
MRHGTPTTRITVCVTPQEERKEIIRKEEEEDANKKWADTESDGEGEDGFEDSGNKKKKAKPATRTFRTLRYYQNDMKQFQALPVVYFKTTIKKVINGKGVDKSPLPVFNVLPGEETDKKMEDLPLHRSIGEMWRSLFDKEHQRTPLPNKMVTVLVNVGNPLHSPRKQRTPHQKQFCQNWTPTSCNKLDVMSNARRWRRTYDLRENFNLNINNAKRDNEAVALHLRYVLFAGGGSARKRFRTPET